MDGDLVTATVILAKELDVEDSILIFIVIKGNILDHRRWIGTSGSGGKFL